MKTVAYPGSFDPITNGHLDVIRRSSRLFDKIFVAVLENSGKSSLFRTDEKIEMIKESVKGIEKVEVEPFSGLLIDYLKNRKIKCVIRGLRAMSDFDYEFQMAVTNKELMPEMETVFIVTDRKYFYLNSTMIKELAKGGNLPSEFVPAIVKKKLDEKFMKN